MELIKSLPESLSCYLLKPVALHFRIDSPFPTVTCSVTCRFTRRKVTLELPSFEIKTNKHCVIRLSGLETIPSDVRQFIPAITFTDEEGKEITIKTKVKTERKINTCAYLNLNKRNSNVYYITLPYFNWDSILPTNTN